MNRAEVCQAYRDQGIYDHDIRYLSSWAMNPHQLRRMLHRRLFGESVATIVGRTIFAGLELDTVPGLYVPTPETEDLVYVATRESKRNNYSTIIDVGTGIGAIALALKSSLPNVNVSGADLDPSAVRQARNNARKHSLDVEFYESWHVSDIPLIEPDLIVADLPYGNEDFLLKSNKARAHEFAPLAFFDQRGPLASYIELTQSIRERDWSPTVIIETGVVPEEVVRDHLEDYAGSLKYEVINPGNSVTALEDFSSPISVRFMAEVTTAK